VKIITPATATALGQSEADLTVSMIRMLKVGGLPPPRMEGATKSPKEMMKAKVAAKTMPTRPVGTTTRKMQPSLPRPRLCAASISVLSMLSREANKSSDTSGNR
jgi:hypothetical protein